jgi:hypothetical protein
MSVAVAGRHGASGKFANRMEYVLGEVGTRRLGDARRGIDHDRCGTTPNTHPPVDHQSQGVLHATLAVQQFGSCEVAIKVTHRRRLPACGC